MNYVQPKGRRQVSGGNLRLGAADDLHLAFAAAIQREKDQRRLAV
jgi:hypothetical protein